MLRILERLWQVKVIKKSLLEGMGFGLDLKTGQVWLGNTTVSRS